MTPLNSLNKINKTSLDSGLGCLKSRRKLSAIVPNIREQFRNRCKSKLVVTRFINTIFTITGKIFDLFNEIYFIDSLIITKPFFTGLNIQSATTEESGENIAKSDYSAKSYSVKSPNYSLQADGDTDTREYLEEDSPTIGPIEVS